MAASNLYCKITLVWLDSSPSVWDNVNVDVDPTQYGCQRGSSAVHASVELYHHWSKATDDCRLKQYVSILLLDFSKAFANIDHTILIMKIYTIYYLPEFIYTWNTAFLTDRHQHVKIDQQVVDWLHIQGAVPKGTLMGVVLFTLIVDDMSCTCPMLKYIDITTEHDVHHYNSSRKMQEVAKTQESYHMIIW